MSLAAEVIAELRAELTGPNPRSRSQMAAALGVSKNTVVGALARAGVETGVSHAEKRSRLDAQRDRIVALADMGACGLAIANEVGVHVDTISRFVADHGIKIRAHVPSLQNHGARASLGGTFGTRRPIDPRDRAEMDCLRDEAIAAGRVTRLPAGHAYGALRWGRSEYAS